MWVHGALAYYAYAHARTPRFNRKGGFLYHCHNWFLCCTRPPSAFMCSYISWLSSSLETPIIINRYRGRMRQATLDLLR